MGTIRQLLRGINKYSNPTINPINSPKTLIPFHSRLSNCHIHSYASGGQKLRSVSENPQSFGVQAILVGLFGTGLLGVSYADAAEVAPKTPLPSESTPLPSESSPLPSGSPSNHSDLEGIAKKERQRLEDLLKSKGMQYGSYPRFTVAVKGQKITIKFQVPPTCEIPLLVANLVSNLGLKVEGGGTGSDMVLRAWNSAAAWQLTLSPPKKAKNASEKQNHLDDSTGNEGDLCILIFRSLISSDRPEIEFIKQGSFNSSELHALVSALQLAGKNKAKENTLQKSAEKSVASLEAMGVRIYGLREPNLESAKTEISWDNIAGYIQQKRDIEDTVLLSLKSPEVYDDIARGTRCKFESNRPRAILFEGPPGTGKTSCARVIASQAGVPLLYLPLEVLMSKYYGESERLLGKVFSLANEIPNGAIIFLDEVDSLATARDNEMHEATRRLLSVLLRQIDGFEQEKKVIVIGATNRKQDLDPALISRFDSVITFDLPDQETRQEIAAQYAKHLTKEELAVLAKATEGMAGRDIRDVCQQAERRWASKIIRGQTNKIQENVALPPIQEYIDSAADRLKSRLSNVAEQREENLTMKKQHLDLD